jgi:muconolactone D-isomerase
MRFLVSIAVRLPGDMDAAERDELLGRERARGRELKAAGTILDMWRVAGRLANVGIWSAPTPTALHGAIASLPVFGWTEVDVIPLADHDLTNDPEGAS